MLRRRLLLIITITMILTSFTTLAVASPGHGEDTATDTHLGIIGYTLVILFVSLIVGLFLYGLRYFETTPGTIPIKKLIIAAVFTISLNSVLFGYVYRDLIF